jgi:hypothetical protein
MSALGMAIVFLEGGPSPIPMRRLLSETNPRICPHALTDINSFAHVLRTGLSVMFSG